MQSGRLKFLAASLLFAVLLGGCSPTPETVGEMAKTSIQDVLRVDPRFEGTGVEVVRVRLSEEGDKKYQGIASIRYHDVEHDVPVKVLVDGLSIKWNTDPDAFSFIPQNKPLQ